MQLAILTGSMHGWLLVQDVQAAFEAAFKAACRHRNGTCMACMACMVMLESMLCLGQPANLMQSMHGSRIRLQDQVTSDAAGHLHGKHAWLASCRGCPGCLQGNLPALKWSMHGMHGLHVDG